MHPSYDEILRSYAAMSDDELMNVAYQYDSLTPGAQELLRAEFSKRKLEPPVIEDETPAPPDGTVEVRVIPDPAAAMVAQSMLRAFGIPSWMPIIRGKGSAATAPFPDPFSPLRVLKEDATRAKELLDQANAEPTDSIPS